MGPQPSRPKATGSSMGKTWDRMAAKVAKAMGKKRGWGVEEAPAALEAPAPPPAPAKLGAATATATANASPGPPQSDSDLPVEGSTTSDATEESDGMDPPPPPVKETTVRKKRKPTYYVRKDEMTRLKEEIEQLQAQLTARETERQLADEAMNKQLVMNAAIASDVKQNEIMVSGIRAMICARNAERDRNPLETFIRMSANEDERRQTLLSIKEQKIFEGKEFIDEYCKRIVNPTRSMQDCQTYDTDKGDFVLDQFDITPFEKAVNARQAYDALLGFFSAQEVSITAMFGVLAVRETDDCGESTATQCRLLTTFKSGVQVETNAVMYLRFCERDDDGVLLDEPYGLVTIDYVNQDDLFPYQPTQRVREDITMVGIIRAFPNPAYATAQPHERAGIPEKVVGMARWGFTRLVKPEIPMPFGAAEELRSSIRAFSDFMPMVMNEIINTRQVSKFY